jgi:hypothetical protein
VVSDKSGLIYDEMFDVLRFTELAFIEVDFMD